MTADPHRENSSEEHSIPLVVEFTGGLEMLFADQRKLEISLPPSNEQKKPSNIASLVGYLCDHVMRDPRRELFVQDGTVRPGILVLINDADWELEGGENYELNAGDNILFVSTLHGG
ncbi:MAG: Ubiquitin- modifier 1 [Piccolia ochrophora]|nr:MAG: Ubiquitin- modifier 1 [Piccolia ochrophora]